MTKRIINYLKNKHGCVYIIIALLCVITYILLSFLANEFSYKWAFMGNIDTWFGGDYYRQIVYAQDLKNIYFNTSDAPFPPFAYLFYHLIYIVNPFQAETVLSSWTIARDTGNNRIIFYIREIIFVLLFVYLIFRMLKGKHNKLENSLISGLIILSIPFMFGAIYTGNVIFLVVILLLAAIYLRNFNSKIAREIALIFIAIAASIKVYPAIFGLLYIKEKRYKEAIRLVIYGMLLFFVPFAFTGGIIGLTQYIKVLLSHKNMLIPRYTSISPMIIAFIDALNIAIDSNKINLICSVISNLFLIVNIISFFKTKSEYTTFILLSSILCLYIPDSYRYVAVYMVIPFILLINKRSLDNVIEILFFVLLSLVFIIPIWNIKNTVDLLVFIPIYLINIVCYIETWIIKKQ